MAYTFVESRGAYSVYLDRHGERTYFVSRMYNHLVWDTPDRFGANQLTLAAAVQVAADEGLMLSDVQPMVTDPDQLGECCHCDTVGGMDNLITTSSGDMVCADCIERRYIWCERCEEYGELGGSNHVEGEWWCSDCCDAAAMWCEECDAFVYCDGYHYEDHPDESCYCEAPNQKFALPVYEDGQIGHVRLGGYLDSDQTHEVTVARNEITRPGIRRIHIELDRFFLPAPPMPRRNRRTWADSLMPTGETDPVEAAEAAEAAEVEAAYNRWREKVNEVRAAVDIDTGAELKNAEGSYVKRLKKAIHKRTKNLPGGAVKIDDQTMAKIGQIAAEFAAPLDVEIDITRDLNRDAEEFAHADSCWWTDYSSSRCVLKNNHGFGMRSFDDGYVDGRVWVFPAKARESDNGDVTLTIAAVDDETNAYIVFNGYGELSERTGPQVLAAATGLEVAVHGVDLPSSSMYINATAHVVTTPEFIDCTFHVNHNYLPDH